MNLFRQVRVHVCTVGVYTYACMCLLPCRFPESGLLVSDSLAGVWRPHAYKSAQERCLW